MESPGTLVLYSNSELVPKKNGFTACNPMFIRVIATLQALLLSSSRLLHRSFNIET